MGKGKKRTKQQRDEQDPAVLARSHGRKPEWVRKAAVIAVAQAYHDGKVNWDQARKNFILLDGGKAFEACGTHVKDELKRCWEHFQESGDLLDNPRSGRPIIISRADALTASSILKEGKRTLRHSQGRVIELITYYTTVREAITLEPRIKEIVDKYQCTSTQLYHAMKREDKDLVRRSITFKPAFTLEEMQARVKHCLDQLASVGATPDLWVEDLKCRVYIDEGSVAFSSLNGRHVKVYMDRHTARTHDVVVLPHVNGHDDMKAHWIMAVSSHPAFADKNGVVYWEFTTGTDNIRRRKNTLGQTVYEPFVYTTKKGKDAQSTVEAETADNLFLIHQAFKARTDDEPIFQMDNIRIQANIPDDRIDSRYGTAELKSGQRIRIPPYSPDINQVVEHAVGAIKDSVIDQLADESARGVTFGPRSLQRIVGEVFEKFETGHVRPGSVARNVRKLPYVWKAISLPLGQIFIDDGHHTHHGSGGDWTLSYDR